MLNLLTAIRTKISGSALSSDVGDRIFPDEYPPSYGAPVFPYVVYFIVSDVPEYPGGKTMEGIIIQFSIFSASESVAEIAGILTNLRTLFDDCSMSITGESLVYFIRGNLTPMTEEIETTSGTQKVKHWAQDYELSTVK